MQSLNLLLITTDYELFSFFSRKFERFHCIRHIFPENISILSEHDFKYDFVCVDVDCISSSWISRYKTFIRKFGAVHIIAFNGIDELDSVQEKISCGSENQGETETKEAVKSDKEISDFAEEMVVFEQQMKLACKSDTPVLLVGESGSGKDFAARYIHDHSFRKGSEFVNQNVAEINTQLFESILFGTTKGAFTDAQEKQGLLESAKGGTVFFDEIAELSFENQGKLLGLLDNLVFRKVGSVKENHVDIRFIFATDADMKKLVKQHLFRRQLYYRISVLVIEVPPLRKHMKDVGPLAAEFAETCGKQLTEDAVHKLMQYNWPGNIRQLKNCILRGSILSRSDFIDAEHIELY